MKQYLLVRLLHSVGVMLGVSLIVFVISHLSGDPAVLMLPRNASRAQLEQFRQDMGLDRPIIVQYGEYLSHALRGDLGQSIWTHEPALSAVLDRFPATLQLAAAALALSLLFALPAGIYTGTHAGSPGDRLLLGVTVLGQSIPVFWLGLMMIGIFSVSLRWLPVGGIGTPAHLVLPAVALSVYSAARTARLLRSSMLESIAQEYIRTARAKGLPRRAVVWAHALRNALIPVITMVGLQLGSLLGGVVVTETVFSWPGVGRLIAQSITARDFPLLQACVLFLAVIFVTINVVVDLLYAVVDPRIRIGT